MVDTLKAHFVLYDDDVVKYNLVDKYIVEFC